MAGRGSPPGLSVAVMPASFSVRSRTLDELKVTDQAGRDDTLIWCVRVNVGADGKALDAMPKRHHILKKCGCAGSPDLVSSSTVLIEARQTTAKDAGHDNHEIVKRFADAPCHVRIPHHTGITRPNRVDAGFWYGQPQILAARPSPHQSMWPVRSGDIERDTPAACCAPMSHLVLLAALLKDRSGWGSSPLSFGFLQPFPVAQDQGEVAAGGQGVGVVGAEHAGHGLQRGAVFGLGFP